MQISLRSYLAAGSAAVVGASAIALTPVLSQPMSVPTLPAAATANIALSAGVSDLVTYAQSVLGGTIGAAQQDIGSIIGQVAGYQDDVVLFVNTVVGGLVSIGQQSIGAMIPAIALAGVQLIPNVVTQGFRPALAAFQSSVMAAINIPVTAIGGAVQAIVGIVQAAVGGLVSGLSAVSQAIPAYSAVLGATFNQTFAAAGAAVQNSFGTGAAIGAVVNGLLGPNGVAGTAVKLTLGHGVTSTAGVLGITAYPANTPVPVPSLRDSVLGAVEQTGAGIYQAVSGALSAPGAASRKGRAASSVRAAASVAAPAAAVASGSSVKSAKHGVTRRAARTN